MLTKIPNTPSKIPITNTLTPIFHFFLLGTPRILLSSMNWSKPTKNTTTNTTTIQIHIQLKTQIQIPIIDSYFVTPRTGATQFRTQIQIQKQKCNSYFVTPRIRLSSMNWSSSRVLL